MAVRMKTLCCVDGQLCASQSLTWGKHMASPPLPDSTIHLMTYNTTQDATQLQFHHTCAHNMPETDGSSSPHPQTTAVAFILVCITHS